MKFLNAETGMMALSGENSQTVKMGVDIISVLLWFPPIQCSADIETHGYSTCDSQSPCSLDPRKMSNGCFAKIISSEAEHDDGYVNFSSKGQELLMLKIYIMIFNINVRNIVS